MREGDRGRQELENQVTVIFFGQVEELRAQLRIRNQRDVDISRRLRNGHNTIAKVLQQQQAAAASALEVLPSVDIIHSQMMNIFKAETDFRMQVMPRNNRTSARNINIITGSSPVAID
jgi:flagellar hook-basal body complex protein FliE